MVESLTPRQPRVTPQTVCFFKCRSNTKAGYRLGSYGYFIFRAGSPGEDPDGVDVDRSAKNPAGHERAGDICGDTGPGCDPEKNRVPGTVLVTCFTKKTGTME